MVNENLKQLSRNTGPVDITISWKDEKGGQQTFRIEDAPSLFMFVEEKSTPHSGYHMAMSGTEERLDALMRALGHFINDGHAARS